MNASVEAAVQKTFNRNEGLGASEAGPATGASKWESPVALWREKLGDASNDDLFEKRLCLRMGTILEPLTLELFSERTGLATTAHQKRIHDPKAPWRWVTLDALDAHGQPVEAKSAAVAHVRDWGDQNEDDAVPIPYYFQAMHAMGCEASWKHVWMPLLVLNRQFRLYRVVRNDEVIDLLREREREFMECVWKRTPPPPRDLDDIGLLYPTNKLAVLEASVDLSDIVQQLANAKGAKKAADELEKGLLFEVKKAMGEYGLLVDQNGQRLCTWNQNKPSMKFDLKSFEHDHPDLFAQYLVEKEGARPLLVKIPAIQDAA